MERCVSGGLEVPEQIRNAPDLAHDLMHVWEAYIELEPCRIMAGTMDGVVEYRIPWTAMRDWCGYYGFDRFESSEVIAMLQKMDVAYVNFKAGKREAEWKRARQDIKR